MGEGCVPDIPRAKIDRVGALQGRWYGEGGGDGRKTAVRGRYGRVAVGVERGSGGRWGRREMARLAVMTMTAPVMSRIGWRGDVEPERKSQESENTGRRSSPELTARSVVRRLARCQRMRERDGMVVPRVMMIWIGVGLGVGW